MVVVPARPGPLVRLSHIERGRDEIDDVLDELLGAPDDSGPGPVDACLLVGGLGMVAAGQLTSLPPLVSVLGAVAAGLGAVLPLRSLVRRLSGAKRARRVQSLIAEGSLLRVDHPSVEALLGAHENVVDAMETLAASPRAQAAAVAHDAMR